MMKAFGHKYSSSPGEVKAAARRVIDVLELLATQLRPQRGAGRRFLVGDALSAVDVYWATFCNLISPLPAPQLPMPENLRALFTASEPDIQGALDRALLEHRDRIYQEYLGLPVEL